MTPPAPVARVGGVFDGFRALPNNPMDVEFEFMFRGSDTDRSDGIRLGLSAAHGSPGTDSLAQTGSKAASPSHAGDVDDSTSLDGSMSPGVTGIESEPLIAAAEVDEAMKQRSWADGAAASARELRCTPCNFLGHTSSRCRRDGRSTRSVVKSGMVILNCERGGERERRDCRGGGFGIESVHNLHFGTE